MHVKLGLWEDASHCFEAFRCSLENHISVEESIVFPSLEVAFKNINGPTSLLRVEHVHIQAIKQRLHDALTRKNAMAFFDHADTFQLLLAQHNEKEECILYPTIEHISNDKKEAIVHAITSCNPLCTTPEDKDTTTKHVTSVQQSII